MKNSKNLAQVSLFTSLIILGAYISIPLGPVSISLQSFFIMMGAYFLKEKICLATLAYTLLGLMGLPVFAGGQGGLFHVLNPGFGFIIAMNIFSYFLGKFLDGRSDPKAILVSYLVFSLSLYPLGLVYMSLILNLYLGSDLGLAYILRMGMLIFLPGDILKSLLASLLVSKINKTRP